MSERKAWIYILTNSAKTVLYIGVTQNIARRMDEHRNRLISGFASTYNCDRLIYVEEFSYISAALDREKELKKWSRKKKETLINTLNPEWNDLFHEIILDR